MIVTNYTPEDLKKLPLRAIVALSARCARRVQHLALLPEAHPESERCEAAVASAIRLAEGFAKGSPCSSPEAVVAEVEACRALGEYECARDSAMAAVVMAAHAAATAMDSLDLRCGTQESQTVGAPKSDPLPHLADVTADLAARGAFLSALEAISAGGHADAFVKAAVGDYEKLRTLELGRYPEPGAPIDPCSQGPLGRLECTL